MGVTRIGEWRVADVASIPSRAFIVVLRVAHVAGFSDAAQGTRTNSKLARETTGSKQGKVDATVGKKILSRATVEITLLVWYLCASQSTVRERGWSLSLQTRDILLLLDCEYFSQLE